MRKSDSEQILLLRIKASARPPSDKIRDFIESKIKSLAISPSVLLPLAICLKTLLTYSKQTHKVHPPSLTRSSDFCSFIYLYILF